MAWIWAENVSKTRETHHAADLSLTFTVKTDEYMVDDSFQQKEKKSADWKSKNK